MRHVAGRRPSRSTQSPSPPSRDRGGPLSAAGRYKPVLDFLAATAALAIPYVAFRVLIVAHFNVDVAIALTASSDPVRLVLSVLLLAIPMLLFFGGVACAFHGARAAKGKGRFKYLPWLALALALSTPFALTNYSGDWTTILVMLASLLLAVQAGWFVDEADRKPEDLDYVPVEVEKRSAQAFYRGAPAFLGITLLVVTVSAPMWLPAERVYIKEDPTLVHFLSVEDDEAVLFIPEDNAVRRVPLKDLSGRQYCQADEFETIAEDLFGGPRGLPKCPD